MSRIYKVAIDVTGSHRNENELLVRAVTKAGALRFVAEKTMVAEVASQDDLIRLVTAGVKVEESAEPETAEDVPQTPVDRSTKQKVWA